MTTEYDDDMRAALREMFIRAEAGDAAMPLVYLDEEAFADLHDRVTRLARSYGLKGSELDEAVAGAARAIATALQRQKARAAGIRLVAGD